jgi:hypothetical protein
LTISNRSKVLRASRSIRVTVTTSPGASLPSYPVEFAPVDPRARDLLAVDVAAAASGSAQLLKLAVEGLAHGADAGIADKPFFGVSFDHNL